MSDPFGSFDFSKLPDIGEEPVELEPVAEQQVKTVQELLGDDASVDQAIAAIEAAFGPVEFVVEGNTSLDTAMAEAGIGVLSPVVEASEAIDPLTQQIQALADELSETEQIVLDDDKFIAEYTSEIEKLRGKIVALQTKVQWHQNNKVKQAQKAKELFDQQTMLIEKKKEQATQQEVDEQFKAMYNKYKPYFERLNAKLAEEYNSQLTDYQVEDILYTVACFLNDYHGVLNANVMGAGKTLEQAVFIDILQTEFMIRYGRKPKMLWVTKKKLVPSTQAELMRWCFETLFYPVTGPNTAKRETREMMIEFGIATNAVVMVNYDMLSSTPKLIEIEWDLVFIDEVHQLKGGANDNGPTQRFSKMRELLAIEAQNFNKTSWARSRTSFRYDLTSDTYTVATKQLPFVSMLSATPVQNRVEETWCWLHLFHPDKFGSLGTFKNTFVKWGFFNPEQLLTALKGQFIRQDPELIYSQRPSKLVQIVEVERTAKQDDVYQEALADVLSAFDDEDAMMSMSNFIQRLTRLRQIELWPPSVNIEGLGRLNVRESGKVEACIELLEQFLGEGEQVVVWTAQFLDVLWAVAEELGVRNIKNKAGNPVRIDFITGQTKDPASVESRFQNGEIDVLLCNMKSAGEGFNFNKAPGHWKGGASNAIVLDLWYNPQVNNQAFDRIWRQTSPTACNIWILHDPDSVDAVVKAICDSKEAVFTETIERKELRPAREWKNLLMGGAS